MFQESTNNYDLVLHLDCVVRENQTLMNGKNNMIFLRQAVKKEMYYIPLHIV